MSAAKSEPLGLRERNKLHKERMIREAAKRVFIEKGFEGATLREIAKVADVGFGTVFSYAQDKSGLLAMVFVEQLKTLPPLFEPNGAQKSILDELMTGLSHLYVFWAAVPMLSLHVLQQMEFYTSNPHMESIVARRRAIQRELAKWIFRLREQKRIRPDTDCEQAAETLFAVYTSAVREWTATTPGDVPSGIRRLRRLMLLPLQGLEYPVRSSSASAAQKKRPTK